MSAAILLSLFGMAFAASWTPGPNNSMLASSGATYGIRASLPHVMGINLGFPVMIFLVGIGMGELFHSHPMLQEVLRFVGAAMMLWIAYKIGTAAPPGSPGKSTRPLLFIEAAGFQWVNPKGWLAAIAVTSQFVTTAQPVQTSLIVAFAFTIAGFTSTFAWVSFGQAIGGLLNTPQRLRLFNLAMALILVVFTVALLLGRHTQA